MAGKNVGKKNNTKKAGMSPKMKKTVRRSVAGVCLVSSLLIAAIPGDRSGSASAAETLVRRNSFHVFEKINELNGVKSDESYYTNAVATTGARRGLAYSEDKADPDVYNAVKLNILEGNALDLAGSGKTSRWSYEINSDGELVEMYSYYTDQPSGYPVAVGIINGVNPAQVSAVANLNIEHMLCGNFDYYLPDEYADYMTQHYWNYAWTVEDPTQGTAYRSADTTTATGAAAMSSTDTLPLTELGKLFPDAANLLNEYQQIKSAYMKEENGNFVERSFDELVTLGVWDRYHIYHGPELQNPEEVFCKNHMSRVKTEYLTHHTLTRVSTANVGTLYSVVPAEDGEYKKITDPPNYIMVVTDTNAEKDPTMSDAAGHLYASTLNAVAIANDAFRLNTAIRTVTLDSEFQYVGDGAFNSCTSLSSVTFPNVLFVGNDVFNDCTSLVEVNLSDDLKVIGNQAFYHCVALPEITVPKAVNTIGFGAFAECGALASVAIDSSDACQIRDYAFYNDPALSAISFSSGAPVSLGKAVFALGAASTLDKMQSFTFPAALMDMDGENTPKYKLFGADVDLFKETEDASAEITGVKTGTVVAYDDALDTLYSRCEYDSRIGDFLLANRQYITTVNVNVLGASAKERIPMNTFQGCTALKSLNLDASLTQLQMDANIFRSSTNVELTVGGPESSTANTGQQDDSGRYYARPRQSCWACFSAVADYVPYCYGDGHYEVGYPIQEDSFLFDLAVAGSGESDKTAEIKDCTYMGSLKDSDLFGTAEDEPFSIPSVVAGYKVQALQAGALDKVKDHIEYLSIPDDTLTAIGSGVFADSAALKGVDIGNSVRSIGEKGFADCDLLKKVIIGEGIGSVEAEAFADCPQLEHVYWDVPSELSAVSIGTDAFKTDKSGQDGAAGKLYFHGYAEDPSYGPLVYAMGGAAINSKGTGICYMSPVSVDVDGFSQLTDENDIQTFSMIKDKKSGKITLIDYPRYQNLPAYLRAKLEGGDTAFTDPERQLILESCHLTVPAAVQSISVNAFLSATENNLNWDYLSADKQKLYHGSVVSTAASGSGGLVPAGASAATEPVYGLFSSPLDATSAANEGKAINALALLPGDDTFDNESDRGNDWVVSVVLPSVDEIPAYAFDSCERLQSVNIGDVCSEVGTLAFRDCNAMTGIGTGVTTNNPNFVFDNYLLYQNLSNGSKEINCCLPYRGTSLSQTETTLSSASDPNYLSQVSSIHESAFAGCDKIRQVDLSDTSLAKVGVGCFDGCSKLNSISLPDTVTTIGDQAFTNCADGLIVTIPNEKTYVTKDAFDAPGSGNVVYVRTPQSSTAYAITNEDDATPANTNINWLDLVAFLIRFYNDDYVTQIGETQTITIAGSNGRIPDTGTLVSTRNASAPFSHWEWSNPKTGEILSGQAVVENVNEDRNIYAVYEGTTHTVIFNNDDGTRITTRIVDDGGYVSVPNERNLTTQIAGRNAADWTFDSWIVISTSDGVRVSVDPHDDPITMDLTCTASFVSALGTPTPTVSGGNADTTPTPTGGTGGTDGTATPTTAGGGTGSGTTPTGGSGTTSGNTASANTTGTGYFAIVENGSGSGQYPAGSVITITAYAPPEGRTFDRWTTSNTDIGISNAKAISTTFIMPSHDVKVTATYTSAAVSGNAAATTVPNRANATTSGNVVTATPVPAGGSGTEVRITTDTIENNKKNLGAASVAGSTDNFVVKVTDSAAATAAVEQALRDAYGERFTELRYAPFDISLYDSTGTYLVSNANNLAVTITLPIPEALLAYGGNNKAGSVVNGQLQELAVQYTTIDGVPCMRFTATHFSPYVIFADTGNLVRGITDLTPKTGDGIAPKWFLSAGMLSMSAVLFLWKGKEELPELQEAKKKK